MVCNLHNAGLIAEPRLGFTVVATIAQAWSILYSSDLPRSGKNRESLVLRSPSAGPIETLGID